MGIQDKILKETADTRNKLEEYIYRQRDRVSGELKPYCTEKEAEVLKTKLDTAENWLYDEGFDEPKAVYEDKLNALMETASKPQTRFTERTKLVPEASKMLITRTEQYLGVANSTADKYKHLTDKERKQVRKSCDDAVSWLHKNQENQGKAALNTDVKFTANQIKEKIADVAKVCQPIVSKAPPKPKKEKKEKKDKKEKEGKKEEPTENGDAPKEKSETDPMELD